MKDVERAYLAGLFDGEGCASVTHSHYKKKIKNGIRLYRGHKASFVISNQDIHALKAVLGLFKKGGIYSQTKEEYGHRKKTSYDFRITEPNDVIKAIELISLYVKIKEKDLENLKEAAMFILKVRGTEKRHKWTEEEEREFEKFAEHSRALKGAGKRKGRPREY